MILDTLAHADRYAALHPRFAAAFAWLRRGGWATAPLGRTDLDGARLYATVMEAPAKPRAAARLECHRRYIDIQYVAAGTDEMGWSPLAACGQPVGPFAADPDCGFFLDAPHLWVPVPAGVFVVFFPEDAHAPMAGTGTIRKVVAKVAVEG